MHKATWTVSMPEKNLGVLLASIKPRLRDEQFVFCSVLEREYKKLTITPICVFREQEDQVGVKFREIIKTNENIMKRF